MTSRNDEEPGSGFPALPPEDIDQPVVEGVREITQDPNFDPEIDNEEDYK